MDDLENTARWEAAIGKLIFAFAGLELILLRLYESLMPHRDYFGDDFESRFNKVIGALRSEYADRTVIDQLIEAKKLSEIRHLVAHSTLYLDVFIDDDGTQVHIEQAIRDLRDRERSISLSALEKAASDATTICLDINSQFARDLWGLDSKE